MTVMKKAVCFQQDSHQASAHERRMRRERLIQPTKPAPIVGMIRRASVASAHERLVRRKRLIRLKTLNPQ
ncbi:hypothetical protein FVA07_10435 [Escherichia coli]|nr:hypothetical protein FVA07_10435 [Escherichia coli]